MEKYAQIEIHGDYYDDAKAILSNLGFSRPWFLGSFKKEGLEARLGRFKSPRTGEETTTLDVSAEKTSDAMRVGETIADSLRHKTGVVCHYFVDMDQHLKK